MDEVRRLRAPALCLLLPVPAHIEQALGSASRERG